MGLPEVIVAVGTVLTTVFGFLQRHNAVQMKKMESRLVLVQHRSNEHEEAAKQCRQEYAQAQNELTRLDRLVLSLERELFDRTKSEMSLRDKLDAALDRLDRLEAR